MNDILQKAQQFLFQRRRAYLTTFKNPVGEIVLEDLAKFCRAHESTFHTDERTAVLLEGRREVWLRVAQHLNLTDDELWALYSRKT